MVRSSLWCAFLVLLVVSAAIFVFHNAPIVSAQGTSPSSTISTGTGQVVWDFAPVVGGTVINTGIQDILSPGHV